jgi:hypothetical protein
MTLQEFSNQFDTMLNSYAHKIGFGDQVSMADVALDEYEKSVWLTKAQEELVISCYNGKNAFGDSFESTEELRRYLSNLVTEDSIDPITSSIGTPLGMDSKSKFFTLPDDLWFITYEDVTTSDGGCGNGGKMDVYPVTQDEYLKIKRNPFRGANNRRALRLDLADGVVEVVCKYNVTNYYIRYIRKPSPIILEDLPDNLTIEGSNCSTPCELHEALHQRILERAVRLALQSKGIRIEDK